MRASVRHVLLMFPSVMTITTADARAYTAARLADGASNAMVNRHLIILKRMCTLAMQAEKLMARPYIPLLKEHNVRKGFFEPQQAASVQRHLPAQMRGIAAFAFVTGWRTPSEILPLEWRQVDLRQWKSCPPPHWRSPVLAWNSKDCCLRYGRRFPSARPFSSGGERRPGGMSTSVPRGAVD